MDPPDPELAAARAALRAHVDRLGVGFIRTGLLFAGLLMTVSILPVLRIGSEFGWGEAADLGAADGLCSNLCACLVAGAFGAVVARPAVRFRFHPLLHHGELRDGEVVRVDGWGAVAPGGWLRLITVGAQVFAWIGGLPALPYQIRYASDGAIQTVQAFGYPEDSIEEGPVRLLVAGDRAWVFRAGATRPASERAAPDRPRPRSSA